MDNTKVSRENLDKLLDFVTKEKYIGWMEKVKTFAQNEPTHPLNEAEAFLLMLSTTEGLIDSLKLWQIKEDCEEMEREICQPLFNIKTSMDMIKASKELALILNTTLQVVNFLKKTEYKAVSIEDLKKLDDIKDITSERSLLAAELGQLAPPAAVNWLFVKSLISSFSPPTIVTIALFEMLRRWTLLILLVTGATSDEVLKITWFVIWF